MSSEEPEKPVRPENLSDFLDHFLENHRDDVWTSVNYGNYSVTETEFAADVVDWTMQYLQYMSCPPTLEAGLTKAVLEEAKANYLNGSTFDTTCDAPDGGINTGSLDQINVKSSNNGGGVKGVGSRAVYKSMNLLQNVTSTVNEVCKRLKMDQGNANGEIRLGRVAPSAVVALKNGRRKMEDRHTIIHDLNAVFEAHAPKLASEPPSSFYAVYDGHAGKDAAAYSASQVHEKILASEQYPSDPVAAIREAFLTADDIYLEKGKSESLRSGTTAVCTLIRGNTLYAAWLGDSQVMLVRNGQPVKIVEPHKPNRPDEKDRIEELGGAVIYWGTWRVNGQLAVSRAIG